MRASPPTVPGRGCECSKTRGSGRRAATLRTGRPRVDEGPGRRRVHLDFRLAWKICVYSEQPDETKSHSRRLRRLRQRICGSALEKETPPRLRPRAVAGLSTDVPVLFSRGPAALPPPGRALLNVKPVPPPAAPVDPGRSTSSSSAAAAKPRAASRPRPPPPVAMSRSIAAACSSSSPGLDADANRLSVASRLAAAGPVGPVGPGPAAALNTS
mmetsp:Transcript_3862/g.17088  ORF Transcript_3862/g.17088 Transcript_3862/m.17088 type:complete len:213 (-) Transcript_3862:530-1168(-)